MNDDPGYGWSGCYGLLVLFLIAACVFGWFAGTWVIRG